MPQRAGFVGRLISGHLGGPEGGSGGGLGLEDVAQLTGWFLTVLEAQSVHLEISAPVLGSVEGGTFVTHHHHLGGGHILTTVAHNLDIVGLRW